jgi:hypothetical protein
MSSKEEIQRMLAENTESAAALDDAIARIDTLERIIHLRRDLRAAYRAEEKPQSQVRWL